MKDKEKILYILAIIFRPYIAYDIMVSLGYPAEQLLYYMGKWSDKGFYEWGTSVTGGWFIFSKLNGEYKRIFDQIKYNAYDLPKREIELKEAKKRILTDIEEADFSKDVNDFKKFIIKAYMGGLFR